MTQVRQREAQRIFEAAVARYQMYPEYHDSGIAWLGEIPAHWDTIRLKLLCEINPSKFGLSNAPSDMEVTFLPMENIGENGELDLSETRELDTVASGYTHFRDGDVIIAKITPCFENGKGALVRGLVNGVGFGTTELYVLRVKSQVIPEFIYYLTRSTNFRSPGIAMMQGAAGQKRVRTDFIADYPVSLPPTDEQRAIATFLDRQTEKIDALIAKKRELIAALHEKRSAIISHAVTKGLNPDAPMKYSGIEWLGEIPAGWRLLKFKRVMRWIEQGWSPQAEGRPADDEEWGVLKVGCVNYGKFDPTENKALLSDTEPIARYEIHKGDLLVSRANTRELLGSAAVVGDVRSRLLLCDKLFRIHLNQDWVLPEFAALALTSSNARYQIEREATGASASMQNVGQDTLFNLMLPLPNIAEQRVIISAVNKELIYIDKVIIATETTIGRLQEYRAALISAAVTGKIDVRGA
jgi:type I restriction enzyme S subunit